MNWLTIKAKLVALGAVLLAVLAAVVRMKTLEAQRDKAREQRDRLKAANEQHEAFDDIDTELDAEYSDKEREASQDLKDGKIPDSLRDRNRR